LGQVERNRKSAWVRGNDPLVGARAACTMCAIQRFRGYVMARGVNKVILVGTLGADPETRSMPSGMTVTNIRIATNETWKDKASGAQQERTEWHSIALFGRLGEIASEYLRKGSQVFVEGKLRTRKWQDKQGNDRYTTEIIGDNMQMLGGRSGGAAGGGGGGGGTGGERGGSSRRQRGFRRRHPVLGRRFFCFIDEGS